MKKRKKIQYLFILIPFIYLLLLFALYYAEAGKPGSHIQTIPDALWYSIVTISTVGYGDVTPVTTVGKIISTVYLIMSTGILVTLFSAAITFLGSEALPQFILRFRRNDNWYYFASIETESITLARNILLELPEAVIIFGEKPDEQSEKPDFPCYYLQAPLSAIVKLKKGKGNRIIVFFMAENDIGSNSRGLGIHKLPVDVYARTANGQDSLSGNVNFFHTYECCAREYWRSHPLCSDEKDIILIGFGNYGQYILERAILTNVIAPDQKVTYHIFGEAKTFLQIHPNLGEVFHIMQSDALHSGPSYDWAGYGMTKDHLYFHNEPWENSHQILQNADRIIICDDDEQKGWSIFWNLQRYYCIKGRIDLRSNREAPGVSYFGTNDDIYNPDQILRRKLNASAIALNEIYRQATPGPTLDFAELDDFLKQSKIAAADHILMKVRLLLQDETITEINSGLLQLAAAKYQEDIKDEDLLECYRMTEHYRWVRFYAYQNWSYGAKVDWTLRTHPMFRPYESLSDEERRQRDYAWELLEELGKSRFGER